VEKNYKYGPERDPQLKKKEHFAAKKNGKTWNPHQDPSVVDESTTGDSRTRVLLEPLEQMPRRNVREKKRLEGPGKMAFSGGGKNRHQSRENGYIKEGRACPLHNKGRNLEEKLEKELGTIGQEKKGRARKEREGSRGRFCKRTHVSRIHRSKDRLAWG